MCAWRGVEDRERAWGWLIKVRRASDIPSKIFSPGKFYVPDRYTPEGGLVGGIKVLVSATKVRYLSIDLTKPYDTIKQYYVNQTKSLQYSH